MMIFESLEQVLTQTFLFQGSGDDQKSIGELGAEQRSRIPGFGFVNPYFRFRQDDEGQSSVRRCSRTSGGTS